MPWTAIQKHLKTFLFRYNYLLQKTFFIPTEINSAALIIKIRKRRISNSSFIFHKTVSNENFYCWVVFIHVIMIVTIVNGQFNRVKRQRDTSMTIVPSLRDILSEGSISSRQVPFGQNKSTIVIKTVSWFSVQTVKRKNNKGNKKYCDSHRMKQKCRFFSLWASLGSNHRSGITINFLGTAKKVYRPVLKFWNGQASTWKYPPFNQVLRVDGAHKFFTKTSIKKVTLKRIRSFRKAFGKYIIYRKHYRLNERHYRKKLFSTSTYYG